MKGKLNPMNTLPHRYPFVMIDRVVEVEEGKWAKGYKHVSRNEWFITESEPCMPHMMIVEALAQLGAFTVKGGEQGGLGFLTSIKGTEFTGLARPGDRIDLYYEVIRHKGGFIMGSAHASVDGEVIVRVGEVMTYHAR